jgi:hypothetical protein
LKWKGGRVDNKMLDAIKPDATTICEFSNPFAKDSVDHINIEIRRPNLWNKFSVKADIWFEKNSTTGLQKIEGDDLLSVASRVKKFIDSL